MIEELEAPKIKVSQAEMNVLRVSTTGATAWLGSEPSDERVDAYYRANRALIDQYLLMARRFIPAAERYIDEVVRNVI